MSLITTEGKEGKQFNVQKFYNLPEKVIHCSKCVVSNQRPRITFDENNVCSACRFSEAKNHKIDWNVRYKHMRMHTALHLMCSIIPLGVTGGQIGFEKSRLDFNDPEKKINKEELEEKINLLVKDNHYVTSEIIESKILDEKPELVRTMSVKPPQVDGKIRLVRIGEVDLQPCGGTHVKSTIEIGKIIIGKIENKGKMNRRINLLLSS